MALEASVKLVFDFSEISSTIDGGDMIPLLAWRYTLEQALVEKCNFQLESEAPHCPSLEPFYKLIRQYLKAEKALTRLVDIVALSQLKHSTVTIQIIEDLFIIEIKTSFSSLGGASDQ